MIEVLSSEEVFRGRIFSISRDTIAFEGRSTMREVIHHPGSVAVIPLLEDGRLLMVSQYRHAIGRRLLEIPAGTLEPGEGAKECALRELEEETGHRADDLEPLASFFLAPGYCDELMHLFLARGLRRVRTRDLEKDEDELIEVVPLDREEALRRALRGEVEDAKTLLALLLARALGRI